MFVMVREPRRSSNPIYRSFNLTPSQLIQGQLPYIDVPRLSRAKTAAAIYAFFTFGAVSGHGVESKIYTALKGANAGIQWQL